MQIALYMLRISYLIYLTLILFSSLYNVFYYYFRTIKTARTPLYFVLESVQIYFKIISKIYSFYIYHFNPTNFYFKILAKQHDLENRASSTNSLGISCRCFFLFFLFEVDLRVYPVSDHF